jgi:predicted transposase/invertase (TIGR01784 family)
VLNINEGKNEDIVNRCKKLAEYSTFIARIHSYFKELENLEEAVKKAIKYCSRHGILKEYLEIHGSEVLNMILTEWNTEDAIAFAKEEGREEGIEKEKLEIARSLLIKGSTPEFVQEITGLDPETIQALLKND